MKATGCKILQNNAEATKQTLWNSMHLFSWSRKVWK